MTKKSILNKFGEILSQAYNHVKRNAGIYSAAMAITAGANAYSQNTQRVNQGVDFGTKVIGGKEYSQRLSNIHGVPYKLVQVDVSDKNPLGVEAIPYLMEKSGKKVVYTPKEIPVDTVYLKQNGDFGIKGDKESFTFDSFIDAKNPMGSNTFSSEKDYSKAIYTMVLPSGDTTYYPYFVLDTAEIKQGNELNFMTIKGNGIKSNDQGTLYITKTNENKSKNRFFKWVKDESRSPSPTSIEKKFIDTVNFSVIKSNKEIPNLKKYETKVAEGQYETLVSGSQDKEVKYTVIKSTSKLPSLDRFGFERTYCKPNGNYTYSIESDKINVEETKDPKIVTINGIRFYKKSLLEQSKIEKVPFHNKVTVKGNIHEYTVPIEDLKNLKYSCDSCGAEGKVKIDTTITLQNSVLNPNYPKKYLPLPNPTTGQVDKVAYSSEPLTKEKKERKPLNLEGRIVLGVVGSVRTFNENDFNSNQADAYLAVQIKAGEIYIGPYAEGAFAGSKIITNQLDTVGMQRKLLAYNVYKNDDSLVNTNTKISYPYEAGIAIQGDITEGLGYIVSAGVARENTIVNKYGEKNIWYERNGSILDRAKITNNTTDKHSSWVPTVSVGLQKHLFNKKVDLEVSGKYLKKPMFNAAIKFNLSNSKRK